MFDINHSAGLTADEKLMVFERLASRITEEGVIRFTSQKSRSQLENKEHTIDKLQQQLIKALTPVRKRVKTKPTSGSVEERLETKKRIAEKKESRRKPKL